MRVFLYEHITGGGFAGEPLPASLAREGDLMLRALANDLKAVPSTEVVITRDARLPSLGKNLLEFPVHSKDDANRLFHHCCSITDAVWVVAPESGGTLEQLSTMVVDNKRILLGSRPEAVHITASKTKTAHALKCAGVATVPTYADPAEIPNVFQQVVIKPDDGAGCLNTRLLDRASAQQWWLTHNHDNDVVQPYIVGEPLSLSLVCHNRSVQLLSCNQQWIAVEAGEFRLTGVNVNAVKVNRQRYQEIAEQVIATIPGLWGYIGIDFIETINGPVVVDINPRLTTSYVGLHRALQFNPAEQVLALLNPAARHQVPLRDDTVFVEALHA
jgi:predicted ATP-grasp superfamily ATP-dependent carboligase